MDNKFYSRVYLKMAVGLFIAGMVAYFGYLNFMNNPVNGFIANLLTPIGMLIIAILEIGIAIWMGSSLHKISESTANLFFAIFAATTGLTLSTIPVFFNIGTIFMAALATALMFGILAMFGLTTKMDLSKWSPILFAGLLTLLIMGIISFFWTNETFFTVYNILGLVIFMGYVALDSHMLRGWANQVMSDEEINKFSTFAALNLFLDFINLFLRLLHIFAESDN